MASKLKALGLVLTALVAASTVTASAAQAGEFTAENYPATITGAQLSKHQFTFFGGNTVNCNVATFHGKLAAAAETLTVGAEYGECSTEGGGAVTVKMTSCDYVFHAGETLEMDRVDGSLDVKCNKAGDGIFFEDPETGCNVKILPQGTLSTLVYTNHTEASDYDVDISLANIKYNQNAQCPGGEGMFFNGTYTGKSTMTGDYEGGGTGVSVD